MLILILIDHVDQLNNKSLMNLALIKRMCTDFNDASALKILYYSLVRSTLEYASLVWHSDSVLQNQCLISIQNISVVFKELLIQDMMIQTVILK